MGTIVILSGLGNRLHEIIYVKGSRLCLLLSNVMGWEEEGSKRERRSRDDREIGPGAKLRVCVLTLFFPRLHLEAAEPLGASTTGCRLWTFSIELGSSVFCLGTFSFFYLFKNYIYF